MVVNLSTHYVYAKFRPDRTSNVAVITLFVFYGIVIRGSRVQTPVPTQIFLSFFFFFFCHFIIVSCFFLIDLVQFTTTSRYMTYFLGGHLGNQSFAILKPMVVARETKFLWWVCLIRLHHKSPGFLI